MRVIIWMILFGSALAETTTNKNEESTELVMQNSTNTDLDGLTDGEIAQLLFDMGFNDEWHEVGDVCYWNIVASPYRRIAHDLNLMGCVCFLFQRVCDEYGSIKVSAAQLVLNLRLIEMLSGDREEQIKNDWTTYVVIISMYSVEAALGLAGNLLLLVTIFRFMGKVTVINIFLASISVADLLVCTFSIPLNLYFFLIDEWRYGYIPCAIMMFMSQFSFTTSCISLMAISIERYIVICYPLKAASYSTISRAKFQVVAIWIFAAISCIPTFFIMDTFVLTCSYNWYVRNWLLAYFTWSVGVLFVIPICVMTTVYIRMGVTLYRSIRTAQTMQQSAESSEANETILQRIQVIRMMVLVMIVFLLCWFPYWLIKMAGVSPYTTFLGSFVMKRKLRLYTQAATFFSSVINPVLYGFSSSQFRSGFKSAFTRGCCVRHISKKTTTSK